MLTPLLAATTVDALTFAIAAAIVLAGAIGVVVARNPVHAALMLVMTLFGVAVLFVEQQANFLAAVQVIVYAGAIVVLFLFVIMFLGVDREENVEEEPLRGQRPLAVGLVVLGLAGLLLMGFGAHWSVGARSVAGAVAQPVRRRRRRPRALGVHDLPLRLRGHLGAARDRRGGSGRARPPSRRRASRARRRCRRHARPTTGSSTTEGRAEVPSEGADVDADADAVARSGADAAARSGADRNAEEVSP